MLRRPSRERAARWNSLRSLTASHFLQRFFLPTRRILDANLGVAPRRDRHFTQSTGRPRRIRFRRSVDHDQTACGTDTSSFLRDRHPSHWRLRSHWAFLFARQLRSHPSLHFFAWTGSAWGTVCDRRERSLDYSLRHVADPASEHDHAALVPHRLEGPGGVTPMPALAFRSGRPLRRRPGKGAKRPVALRAFVVLVSTPLPAPIELCGRHFPPQPQSHAQRR